MRIYIRITQPAFADFSLEVEAGWTKMLEIKQQIFDKQGVPVANQKLTYDNKELEDSKTCADYNIGKDDTIRMTPLNLGG